MLVTIMYTLSALQQYVAVEYKLHAIVVLNNVT